MASRPQQDDTPLVVHVIPSPRARGAQRAARACVDGLDELGGVHHILLSIFADPPEVAVDLSLGKPGGRRSAEGFDFRVALRLRRMLKELGPATVVAHGGDAMKYVVPAMFGTGRPFVYCVIGTYAGPPSKVHEGMWRLIMRAARTVIAVGDEVLDECTDRFRIPSARTVLIPNGRDSTVFRPSSTPHDTAPATLIFVGALTPQKRPERFVELVQDLRAAGHSLRALLVGDGPLSEPLAPSATDQGVEMLGSRSDVPELLRDSDVFVFTSLPAGEGMPGVLIEAGLSGLPTVSTSVPGASSVLQEGTTGFIVGDGRTAMAAAVGQLIEDPARRKAMGSAARAWCASEYSLDVMVARWQQVLQPLVESQIGTGRRVRATLGRVAADLARAFRARRRNSQT